MPLEEQIYHKSQLNIPPEFPDILKQFTKAAIRTQPENLLEWSQAYFKCLKSGEALPVKTRFEIGKSTGLTFGILNILNRQLGSKTRKQPVPAKDLREKWQDLGLTEEALDNICIAGNINLQAEDGEINMDKFVAVSAYDLVQAEDAIATNNSNSQIGQALDIACQLFTNDDEGGASRIDIDQFVLVFEYLGDLKDVSKGTQQMVIEYMKEKALKQDGMVMPGNFQANDCPSFC